MILLVTAVIRLNLWAAAGLCVEPSMMCRKTGAAISLQEQDFRNLFMEIL